MKESQIKKQICDYLDMIPHMTYAITQVGRMQLRSGRWFTTGTPGWPDITCCYMGKFVGIELKTKTGKQSPSQKKMQARIEASGGIYRVVRCLDDIRALILELQK